MTSALLDTGVDQGVVPGEAEASEADETEQDITPAEAAADEIESDQDLVDELPDADWSLDEDVEATAELKADETPAWVKESMEEPAPPEELTTKDPIGPGEHTVAEGDCIASIAYRAGFLPDTLWNHPSNAALKSKRKDPSVLMPGDVVTVPDLSLRHESRPTDARHKFRRKRVPAKLRMRLLSIGEPRVNTNYVLEIEGQVTRGHTDDHGYLERTISPDARWGRLIIDPGPDQETLPLLLGGLDPLDEIRGVQGRLENLGYDCPLTGTVDEGTEAALAAFQQDHNLAVTGTLDQNTRDALKRIHER